MKVNIVIATFNRPESLECLVLELIKCEPAPHQIVIVDSSPIENESIQSYKKVVYIRASHPNQPYQRFVGYRASDCDVIVFLDDDMKVVEKSWLKDVSVQFLDRSIAAVAINFKNDNDFLQNKLPKSKLVALSTQSRLTTFLKALSGYPQLVSGAFWLCGIRGTQPNDGGETHWVSGGAFAAKRIHLYENFNFRLFNLFEQKVGMGEDAILGYTLSKRGKIIYLPKEYFYHNDCKDSTYTLDYKSFGKRVALSRLYLSFEYVRLTGDSKILAFLHFNWYTMWRLFGMFVNQLMDYQYTRSELIRGTFTGWWMAVTCQSDLCKFDNGEYWRSESVDDINS